MVSERREEGLASSNLLLLVLALSENLRVHQNLHLIRLRHVEVAIQLNLGPCSPMAAQQVLERTLR